jgi:hypothetical protein
MGLPHEGDDDLGRRACPGECCRLFAFGRHVSRSAARTIKGSITIRRYLVVLTAHASGTDQIGAAAKGRRHSDTARQFIHETRPSGTGRLGASRPAA